MVKNVWPAYVSLKEFFSSFIICFKEIKKTLGQKDKHHKAWCALQEKNVLAGPALTRIAPSLYD